MLKVKCKYCGKELQTLPSLIKRGGGKYCSLECSHKARVNKIIQTCKQCGTEFEVSPYQLKDGMGKFCSKKCFDKNQMNRVDCVCKVCGKTFEIKLSGKKRGQGKFCSNECKNKFQVGLNSPTWKGGISFEPYCTKFNNEFKERVRSFWGYKCGICGKHQKDNNNGKLSVHHVNYEKMVCCDNTPPLFIALCRSCHAKTNYNRESWEYCLTEYIMKYFDGESYFKR